AFLQVPYGKKAGVLDLALGFTAIAAWLWMSFHFSDWLVDIAGATPEKYVPGAIAILLMMEALRKISGVPITLLVWLLIAYGFFGYMLPGPLQANYQRPEAFILYLYADTNAIPGLVLNIIAGMVLAFIVFGKLMEVSGATQFFTDLAMALMGHRRGGPAKVAVVASGLFGSISSSPVGNIMSTGVVTIPLMKRVGFKPHYAAAIEAVASTGGQIAPPVMGATAFLIAEFLRISYMDVVAAAALPALFYYLCLFMQVDAVARSEGLSGMPRTQLPRLMAVLRTGWAYALPLAFLIYLLFWRGSTPAFAALASAVVLLVFASLKGRLRTRADWGELIFGGGAGMVPLIMIGGAAGVVVGVMNATGLGQSLSFVLVQAGSNWGLLPMLIVTAILCIILGMGMPTTAIYVILSTVIGPALIKMGLTPLSAHLFIFYFGVMSFLTPPVAVSSFVAAGLAETSMWRTGWVGMQLSMIALLLPFIWAYDPALLLDGSWLSIVLVIVTTLAAIMLISRGLLTMRSRNLSTAVLGGAITAAAVAVAVSPVWLGPESMTAGIIAVVTVAACKLWSEAERRKERLETAGAMGE
ncbi:MAG TPA: TRAP transporter fused permease subunit, partial [Pseudolabrys sp.]|nr:TRAP transporter fused permease subunit [Pseudolabrys sp.]